MVSYCSARIAANLGLTFVLLHAEAEAAYLQGQGIARQRQAIVNGLRESVLNFEDGVKAVSPQEVIELMMVSLSSPADTVIWKIFTHS